ncbi:MAG: alpha/beta fold hydrolase [Luteolibacter sp.]
MRTSQFILSLCAVVAFAGCATTSPDQTQQSAYLKEAGKKTLPADQRAALYLDAASRAGMDAAVYNKATADLTVLLRSAAGGSLWNHPLTLSSGTKTYHLRYAKGSRDGVWDPGYFTSFTPSDQVTSKIIKHRNVQDGLGGALVGVHKEDPQQPFSPLVGVAAPVTAVLNFKGGDVTLSLLDPEKKTKADVNGAGHPLAADFSAPLAYYPHKSETWEGLMGAIHVESYMKTTGLYMLQPYDPDRIPLIFVHGLISTGRMWRNVINELEMDPKLRGRYQCWVFAYPTGNPPAYSALRFREELDKVHQLYPKSRGYVLVGHSMGGIVSRMQVTNLDRPAWDIIGKDKAKQFFSNVPKGGLIERATIFHANPHIDRVIFICTPHRGSKMAIGSLGELGMRMISLPLDLTTTVVGSIGNSLSLVTGSDRMPNSVTGLSPKNPTLNVLDSRPITVPYHSIIGDRGRGDTPNSSDGVVEYWSSHLDGAQSELIVPGPHGSCELPETIAELHRILLLHLSFH